MKKHILIAVSLLLTIGAKAQMSLEHEYINLSNIMDVTNVGLLNEPVKVINLSISGKKYATQNIVSSQVILYNLNHTVWKTINLPTITNCKPVTAYYISENLFKLDGHVDMAVQYADTTINFTASGHLLKQVIIDEFGTIINTIDSFSTFTIYNTGTGTDTFKAIAGNWASNTWYGENQPVNYRVYALPGTIPCNICGNGLGLANPVNNGLNGTLSDAIPNPNNGSFKIGYTLPIGITNGEINFYNTNGQQVKSYVVDNSSNFLVVDNSMLPSGVYYYNLMANGMPTTAKKMVVIK